VGFSPFTPPLAPFKSGAATGVVAARTQRPKPSGRESPLRRCWTNGTQFTVAPPQLPAHLHWFQWDANLTFMTGFGLLIVQYYLHAKSYLIDPAVMPLETWEAIAISVASLLAGWAIYEALCRSPLGRNVTVLAALVSTISAFSMKCNAAARDDAHAIAASRGPR